MWESEERKAQPLKNQTCLISGASGGLGKTLARAFWRAGADLILTARSQLMLEELKRELLEEPLGGTWIDLVAADLTSPDAPNQIMAAARIRGGLDVLLNNAAVQGPIGPSWENDWGEWVTTLQINLLALVALCRLAVPLMNERRRGKIINLSGGGATGPRPNFTAYAVSKVGVVRFSECFAKEAGQNSIDVNCVAPGSMDTGMTRAIIKVGDKLAGEQELLGIQKVVEAGRDNRPRAASLCVFLGSPESDGITGKLISAVWDPWERLSEHLDDLRNSDIYTLRRIVPGERGKDWG